jgi:hypothetical protein
VWKLRLRARAVVAIYGQRAGPRSHEIFIEVVSPSFGIGVHPGRHAHIGHGNVHGAPVIKQA